MRNKITGYDYNELCIDSFLTFVAYLLYKITSVTDIPNNDIRTENQVWHYNLLAKLI